MLTFGGCRRLLPFWAPQSLVALLWNRAAGFAITFASAIVWCYRPVGTWFGADFLARLGIHGMALDSNGGMAAQSSPWAALPVFLVVPGLSRLAWESPWSTAVCGTDVPLFHFLLSCSRGSVCPSQLCHPQWDHTEEGAAKGALLSQPSSSVSPQCPDPLSKTWRSQRECWAMPKSISLPPAVGCMMQGKGGGSLSSPLPVRLCLPLLCASDNASVENLA